MADGMAPMKSWRDPSLSILKFATSSVSPADTRGVSRHIKTDVQGDLRIHMPEGNMKASQNFPTFRTVLRELVLCAERILGIANEKQKWT